MEQKTKFIIIGLIVILIGSLFFTMQTYSAKQALERQKGDLEKENTSLNTKVGEMQTVNRRLEGKISALSRDLDTIAKEKEDIQKRFDSLTKEREILIEKLKAQPRVEVREVVRQAVSVAPPSSASGAEDAYWAGILKAKTDLEFQMQNISGEIKSLKISNDNLAKEKVSLELELNNLTREKQDLQRQFEYNKRILDNISQELVREKNDKMQVQDSITPIKNENATLRRQLRSLSKQNNILANQINALQEEKATLEQKFNGLDASLKDRITKISDLKQQLEGIRATGQVQDEMEKPQYLGQASPVELPPIVVRPQTTGTAASPGAQAAATLQSRVMAINKENNFVIIDAGEEAGVRLGATFEVYREGKNIATIEVMQVRKTIAACDIKRETMPVKIGDTIR